MPISTRTFLNGRSTAVRIPAEFGIKPGEEVLVSQDRDGTVRVARAGAFSSFFAAVDRMRADGQDPAATPPLERSRMGTPRKVDLASEPAARYRARRAKARKAR